MGKERIRQVRSMGKERIRQVRSMGKERIRQVRSMGNGYGPVCWGRCGVLWSFVVSCEHRHLGCPTVLVHIVHKLESRDQTVQVRVCAGRDYLHLLMLFSGELHSLLDASEEFHNISQCTECLRDPIHAEFHPSSEGVLVRRLVRGVMSDGVSGGCSGCSGPAAGRGCSDGCTVVVSL